MGQMSDYNIQPKPKVGAEALNECPMFCQTLDECCMLGQNDVFYW